MPRSLNVDPVATRLPASVAAIEFGLDVDDHVFGSHRSRGEFIAKGMSAIRQSGEQELLSTMERFGRGELLAVLDKAEQAGCPGSAGRQVVGLHPEHPDVAAVFVHSIGEAAHVGVIDTPCCAQTDQSESSVERRSSIVIARSYCWARVPRPAHEARVPSANPIGSAAAHAVDGDR